ncbi:MAG: sigma-E processing peptidase SpoIIGA [Ruminiclostridium sp.]|nr:sigma-E processing peptidase SpoIIGA [Ruminiclostridium sp.]
MVIYLDILILENIVINFMILSVTARFSRIKTSSFRKFLGALVGAIYVIFIFLPDMKIYTSVLAKIILSFIIIAISFKSKKLLTLLKTLALFYITTFLFAGAGFALLYFNAKGIVVKNGVMLLDPSLPYLNTKWTQILLALALAGIVTRILWEIIHNIKDKMLVQLYISFDSKIIGLYALVDTGNALHDPLTNMPVVVVEFGAIKEILPGEIRAVFEESGDNDLGGITNAISNTSWFTRFRLIPFTSLGRENGMLVGFKPDFIEIDNDNEKKDIKDVVIGIYTRSLSKNEKYRALLSPELI